MNKSMVIAITILLILGIAFIIASKIAPNVLFTIGIVSVIAGILLTAFVLYQNYKSNWLKACFILKTG